MKQKHLALLGLVFFVTVIAIQFVLAVDFNQPISAQDKATFDQILTPVMKIYNLAKYISTAIEVVVLLFAGISFITSSGNPGKREQAKEIGMYVFIGLAVIWAAPWLVNFMVG